jgi:hypothetical protein
VVILSNYLLLELYYSFSNFTLNFIDFNNFFYIIKYFLVYYIGLITTTLRAYNRLRKYR